MKILYVIWRDDRPRFSPSPTLRRKGHEGHDLKILDPATGALRWMTKGEALDWSDAFQKKRALEDRQARDRKAADKARAEREKKRALALLPKVPRARSYTLGQMMEDHLANGTAEIAANTLALYRSCYRMVMAEEPLACATEAGAISRPVVVGIYDSLKIKRGLIMAFTGINYLRIAYNWAIDRGKVTTSNPASRIERTRPGQRVRMIRPGEFLHLVATADRLGRGDVGDMVAWGAFGCQRPGDRLAMRKADIVEGRFEITQQKTGQDVKVRIAAFLARRMRARPAHKAATFFARENTDLPLTRNTYYAAYQKVLAEAVRTMPGLAGFRDQDLRDTAISWMARAGCTEAEIMAVSGHNHAGKTYVLGHYMDIDHDLADAAIKKLDRWFAAELKKLNLKGEAK